MKFVIASDVHGSAYYMERLMQRVEAEQPDRILLLGDLLYHGPRNDLPRDYAPKKVIPVLNNLKERIIAVRGNCEAEVDQMVLDFPCMADYATVTVEEGTLYLTHGHHHNPEHLPPLPKGTAFLSGHTHVGRNQWVNGVLCLNPGSVSIPKDGFHSYMVYENGIFTRKDLDGECLFVQPWKE